MDVEPATLAEPDAEDADSLVSSNDPDDMANEQTWPTEEEMQDADDQTEELDPSLPDAAKGTTPKAVKRIPKGMSEYQAAWIADDDDEDEDEDEDVGQDGEMQDMEEEAEEVQVHVDDDNDMETGKNVTFQDLDVEEEERQ